MTTTAETWFYGRPEAEKYLITERLNSTFWNARIVSVYWKGTSSEPPFSATGFRGQQMYKLRWEPGEWLSLSGPEGDTLDDLVDAINTRVLVFPATFTYEKDGERVYEWHRDGGAQRWSEIQGRGEFFKPQRLAAR